MTVPKVDSSLFPADHRAGRSSFKRNKTMSRTSEGLEPHLYFPVHGVNREIPPDEPGMECPHKTVIMTNLNDESILVCEDCGEEVEI